MVGMSTLQVGDSGLVKVKPYLQTSIDTCINLQIVAAFAYERFGNNVMVVKEVMTEPLAKARLEEMIEEV